MAKRYPSSAEILRYNQAPVSQGTVRRHYTKWRADHEIPARCDNPACAFHAAPLDWERQSSAAADPRSQERQPPGQQPGEPPVPLPELRLSTHDARRREPQARRGDDGEQLLPALPRRTPRPPRHPRSRKAHADRARGGRDHAEPRLKTGRQFRPSSPDQRLYLTEALRMTWLRSLGVVVSVSSLAAVAVMAQHIDRTSPVPWNSEPAFLIVARVIHRACHAGRCGADNRAGPGDGIVRRHGHIVPRRPSHVHDRRRRRVEDRRRWTPSVRRRQLGRTPTRLRQDD